jgi:zinc ribbon protein
MQGSRGTVEYALPSLTIQRDAGAVGYADRDRADPANRRPYNGAALSPSDATLKAGTVFCRECGRPIEADARFCRFCGKSQADPVAGSTSTSSHPGPTGAGLEERLRQLFPRHHLQDEFMHIGTIAAFLMALIGFVLGFFLAYSWLGTNFLLGSIALLLFLILRESTLSHIRVRGAAPTPTPTGGRTHAGRRPAAATTGVPAEAANAESSPPATPR